MVRDRAAYKLANLIEACIFANREVNGPTGAQILSDEQLRWVRDRYGEAIRWETWDAAWGLLHDWGVYHRKVAP